MQKLVAAGFIYSDGLALLARRALGKSVAPGQLHLPGGHVEPGEQPETALRREIEEEFGVQVRVVGSLHAFEYDSNGDHTVGIAFAATLTGQRTALRLDPSDNAEILWVDREELERHFPDKTNHNYVAAIKGFAYFENVAPGKSAP